MAKTTVTFEYTDKNGTTHQVDSVQKVPKEYLNTMLAVGQDEPEEQTRPASDAAFDLQGLSLPGGMQPPLVLALLIAGIVTLKGKSFIQRVIAGTLAGGIAFYLVYSWGDASGFLKTSEKKIKRVEAPVQDDGR